MGLEILGGLIIGFGANNWLGRLVLPVFVGLWACCELFFTLRKNPISGSRKFKCLKAGVSENEIKGINKVFGSSLKESGFVGFRVYAQQFLFSTITTLVFSLLAGTVKLIFFSQK